MRMRRKELYEEGSMMISEEKEQVLMYVPGLRTYGG
jgi:hypothetical protein